MARPRVQVQEDQQPRPRIAPIASPVDTFSTTGAHSGDDVARLVQSLGSLSPQLAQLGGMVQERENQADAARGEQVARELSHSSKSYNDAIKKGLIRPDQSPWFRYAAQETFGKRAAANFVSDLRLAAGTDETLASSTNTADFDAFAAKFREKWLKENVPEGDRDLPFESGFGRDADGALRNERLRFAEEASKRFESRTFDDLFQLHVSKGIDGVQSGADRAAIIAAIEQANDELLAGNKHAGKQVNETTAAAIAAIALNTMNPDVLEWMKDIKAGSGKLFYTKEGQAAYDRISQEIANRRNTADDRAAKVEERRKVQVVQDTFKEARTRLGQAQNPFDVNLSDLSDRAELSETDRKTLSDMQEAFVSKQYQDDAQRVTELDISIDTKAPGDSGYVTEQTLARDLATRRLSIPTYNRLINKIEQRDKEGGGVGKAFNDPGLKKAIQRARQLFVTEFGFEGPEIRMRQEAMEAEVTDAYLRWREGDGKNADATKVNEWITKELDARFPTKADAQGTKLKGQLPNATLGPQKPDWNTTPVVDKSWLPVIDREWGEIQNGKRNSFSPGVLSILEYAGIKPNDDGNIALFLAKQQAAIAAFNSVAPDTTSKSKP